MKGQIDPDINIENKTFKTEIVPFSHLQTRKLSEVAKLLQVETQQLKDFLSNVIITKTSEGLRLGRYNKLKRKK